jgi:hypothetical protein
VARKVALLSTLVLATPMLLVGCGGNGDDDAVPSLETARSCLEDAGFSVQTDVEENSPLADDGVVYDLEVDFESGDSGSFAAYSSEKVAQKYAKVGAPALSRDLDLPEVEPIGTLVVETPPTATDEEAGAIKGCV